MKIALGADSAGKPLLDVIAKHLATKPDLEVVDLSQAGYYADIAGQGRPRDSGRQLRPSHPVLRHRHRRQHIRQQGPGNSRRAHPRHLFGRAGCKIEQCPDHHHGRARDRPRTGKIDRRRVAGLGIRSGRPLCRKRAGHRQARRQALKGATDPAIDHGLAQGDPHRIDHRNGGRGPRIHVTKRALAKAGRPALGGYHRLGRFRAGPCSRGCGRETVRQPFAGSAGLRLPPAQPAPRHPSSSFRRARPCLDPECPWPWPGTLRPCPRRQASPCPSRPRRRA